MGVVIVVVVAVLLCGRSADHRMGELDAPLLVSTRPKFLIPGIQLAAKIRAEHRGKTNGVSSYSHFAAELMFGAWRAYAKVEIEQRTGTSSVSYDNELIGKRYLNVLNHTHPEGTGPATEYVFSEAERWLFEENRLDMPRTVVFPFNNDWEGKELQEVMLAGMFGDASEWAIDMSRRGY